MRIRAPQEAKQREKRILHGLCHVKNFRSEQSFVFCRQRFNDAAVRSRISAHNQETKRMQWPDYSNQSPALRE
jgi:hypothetical protein